MSIPIMLSVLDTTTDRLFSHISDAFDTPGQVIGIYRIANPSHDVLSYDRVNIHHTFDSASSYDRYCWTMGAIQAGRQAHKDSFDLLVAWGRRHLPDTLTINSASPNRKTIVPALPVEVHSVQTFDHDKAWEAMRALCRGG